MSHSHSHGHDHSHGNSNIGVAFFLNLIFTIIEIVGGLYTNSIAILSDAVHDAGDCLSIGVSWYLQKVSKREADEEYSYGYQRYSVLGALITGSVLVAGMVVIFSKAIPRLSDPQPVRSEGMIALAFLGIAVNGAAAYRASKGSSLNESIVSWHLLEDVLGWIAVLVGALAIKVWNKPIIDPILSIGISLFVLVNVLRRMARVFRVFLQKAPEGFDLASFNEKILKRPKVVSTHHIHSWSLDGERHVLTAHVVMDSSTERAEALDLKRFIRDTAGEDFEHFTVELEYEGEDCSLPDKDETVDVGSSEPGA